MLLEDKPDLLIATASFWPVWAPRETVTSVTDQLRCPSRHYFDRRSLLIPRSKLAWRGVACETWPSVWVLLTIGRVKFLSEHQNVSLATTDSHITADGTLLPSIIGCPRLSIIMLTPPTVHWLPQQWHILDWRACGVISVCASQISSN